MMYRSRALLDLLYRLTIIVVDPQARRSVKEHKGEEKDDENEDPTGEHMEGDSEASQSTRTQLSREEEDDDDDEGEAEKPWETLTGAKAKSKVKLFQERHWAVTETFYANLAAATERLEATTTQDKG